MATRVTDSLSPRTVDHGLQRSREHSAAAAGHMRSSRSYRYLLKFAADQMTVYNASDVKKPSTLGWLNFVSTHGLPAVSMISMEARQPRQGHALTVSTTVGLECSESKAVTKQRSGVAFS